MIDPTLARFLSQFAAFTPQELTFIGSQATERNFRTGEYFAEAGRVAQEVGFVVEGIFRVCYHNEAGEEFTKYFVEESNFVVDLLSYRHQTPSAEYIEAVTDARVLVFKARDWQAIGQTIAGWPQFEANIVTRALLEKVKRISPLVQQDAATKYRTFLENFPALANRIPLSYLASYIGVTPQSLSRIRAACSHPL